ncbi:hypothetical protein SASPL_122565 [Salvia splendens]|uniref:Alkaline/neutral invertase n=1 Tax=Salvia splendens TaxID=180675 RepID=A0A8X8XJI4_SALSN|nr:hypothetical protein SASPL_122565 [Salvia splendens]
MIGILKLRRLPNYIFTVPMAVSPSEAAPRVLPGPVPFQVFRNLRSASRLSFKESAQETSREDTSKRLVNDIAKDLDDQRFEAAQHLKREKEGPRRGDEAAFDTAVGQTISRMDANSLEEEAWNLLRASMVYYCGSPVGTIAANDPSDSNMLNYDQVFIRDFVPSGIAFLLNGEYEIVRNFILHTLQLQSWEKTIDCHSPGQGLMPASFKVRVVPLDGDDSATEEVLDPDFGEAAIGRVAPVDSGLWWIILLRAYGKSSGDLSVQQRIDVQTGIKMILKLCLADGFDMFPTLLVTDGSCMIDRRMGIHGHPLEIQALFYSALLCAREMLAPEEASADLTMALNNRSNFSLACGLDAPKRRLSYWKPAHMDFRFFSLGNLWAIVCSLVTTQQSHAILDLIEAKWSDLVSNMPLKICYPALEGQEWSIITGSDPKNTPWSYHNGGSWPTLLWQLTVACLKINRPEIAENAIKIAEKRLAKDKWPEYYDTKGARFIGKQARLFQSWSIAGYLVTKLLMKNPSAANILVKVEDAELLNVFSCALNANPRGKRRKGPKQSFII